MLKSIKKNKVVVFVREVREAKKMMKESPEFKEGTEIVKDMLREAEYQREAEKMQAKKDKLDKKLEKKHIKIMKKFN